MEKVARELVIVFTSQQEFQVQIAKEKLEKNSIKTYIVDGHIDATLGTLFSDSYKLEVDISNREKALKLLEHLK